ncbi:hypothetical protein Scep_002404 [Stephania cephalantha]|uniref:Chlororespiratory reduction 4 n=1 Tax=Stephania cephalantha TaxID=152367 RepID=A0AAP0Q4Y2_9MAGN
MNQLKQIHAHTLRNNIDQSKFLIVKLLQIPNIEYAHQLFDLIPQPTVFLYNKLIQAYASHATSHTQCLTLYSQMRLQPCPPNQHSFTFLFAACAAIPSIRDGQKIHTQFLKSGFEFDYFALTALVDMYAKVGVMEWSRQVFDEMPQRDVPAWNSIIAGYARGGEVERARDMFESMVSRNVISWTAMISGYSQNGRYEDVLQLYARMERENEVEPNEWTVASVLPACGNLGALEVGKRVEMYARKKGLTKNLFVSNALLEMYAKCGRIDMAKRVFDEIGSNTNLCSFNSMIMGLAVHGRWMEGLELFDKMLSRGTVPDDITFVGVLLACTHGGLVKQGWEFFKSMQNNFSITPKLEHYGCMVDLLGRAGELSEAYSFIQTMPMKPDSVIWGALLGACSFYSNVEIGEKAAEALFELEPRNPGIYVLLSNIYASSSKWDGVAKVRKLMRSNLVTKAAGYSFVEVDGGIYKFVAEDKSHERSIEVYALLDGFYGLMKLLSYLSDVDFEIECCEE